MKTAFIIHGTGWSPEENWFPWMKSRLEENGYRVIVPKFPTPAGQSLESWKEVFSEYLSEIDENTIFIAHSVGPAFVLNILEQINQKIQACYFVSGFLWFLGLHEFDILNKSYVDRKFDWEKIRQNCGYFYMCHGSNDPYVPLENTQKLADKLWVKIDMIDWGGHLNSETGYNSFEYLLEKIKT